MKQSKYIFSVICVENKIRQVSENEEDERNTNESMVIINEGVGIVKKEINWSWSKYSAIMTTSQAQ